MSATQKIPLSVLARKPHKGPASEISHETVRRRGKAKSQGSQQNRTVNRIRGKVKAREGRPPGEVFRPVDSEARSANARE